MSMLRGAVIGIGGIGKWHGQMIRDAGLETGKAQLVAVCDANPKAVEIATKEFPGMPFYTSPEEMFAKEKLDLTTIATPHHLHAPLAIQALRAG